MKLLGIDYGTNKIGIAFSDESETLAFPYDILKNDKKFFSKLKNLCTHENIREIIIGKSVDYKRNPNKIFNEARAMQEKIQKELDIPVHLYDETLTTQEAKRIQNKKSKLDASAAALILQGYLDKKKYERKHL